MLEFSSYKVTRREVFRVTVCKIYNHTITIYILQLILVSFLIIVTQGKAHFSPLAFHLLTFCLPRNQFESPFLCHQIAELALFPLFLWQLVKEKITSSYLCQKLEYKSFTFAAKKQTKKTQIFITTSNVITKCNTTKVVNSLQSFILLSTIVD